MKIYTTYFENLKNLPDNVIPVAISQSVPKWYGGPRYLDLAPSWDILNDYHENKDTARYTQRFNQEVLDKLDPEMVRINLDHFIEPGCTVALVCYEKPNKFCHRHIVGDWIRKNLGYVVQEL